MGKLINLAIAALLVHAAWRAGTAYWNYYKFRDEVQVTAQFGGALSEREVHARVLEIASELELPISADQVTVRKEGNHTRVEAAYVDEIEILPTYRYPWAFEVNVDAFTVVVPKAEDLIPAR